MTVAAVKAHHGSQFVHRVQQARRWVHLLVSFSEYACAVVTRQWEWLLRRKLNHWSQRGLGEELETAQMGFIYAALERMQISPGERILNLGCREGLTARLLSARSQGAAQVLGVEIAGQMISRARDKNDGFHNVTFVCAPPARLPCADNSFDRIISVEALYFYRDQQRVLKELLRVLKPGGEFLASLSVHENNPQAIYAIQKLGVPVHVRSAHDYRRMLWRAGWTGVRTGISPCKIPPGIRPRLHHRSLTITARKPEPGVSPHRKKPKPYQHAIIPADLTGWVT